MRRCLIALLVTAAVAFTLSGCIEEDATEEESSAVERQQVVYGKYQPVPFFEWSPQRQLWIDFYKAQNETAGTWSYISSWDGNVKFETPSQGFPTPMDTQLTNPLQVEYNYKHGGYVVEQPEPNGLFTSKNTDGTIIMAANTDGTLSPIYTELKVTCFPFPVKLVNGMWVRVPDAQPSIKLTPKKKRPS